MFSSTFSSRDRLRRSKSARSIHKPRRMPDPEVVGPEIAKYHAAAAASHAMRRSERSSTDSRDPYDNHRGPVSMPLPRRHQGSSLQRFGEACPIASASVTVPLTPRQSLEMNNAPRNRTHIEDVAALPPITEIAGFDGRSSELPSSYRRLRKAKSMFSTRQRTSKVASIPNGGPTDLERSPEIAMPRTLRHSMSFLRSGNRDTSRGVRRAKSQDVAIQLARHQFLQDQGGTLAQPRRSSWFASRSRRDHKPFRKTFRATSETEAGVGPLSEQTKSGRGHGRPRTFSVSFTRGIKRVFGYSKTAEKQPPPQQMTGSRGDLQYPGRAGVTTDINSDSKHYGYAMVEPFDFHMPQHLLVSPSRNSICTSNSRVTSWVDSTTANTIATRNARHRKSLSLIEEHDDLNQQLAPMTGTETMENSSQRPVGRPPGAFDSQDLYAALMRQINKDADEDADEEIILGTVAEHRIVPERTASIYSRRSRCTVRHVSSEDSFTSPRSFITAHHGDSRTPQGRPPRSIAFIPPLKVPRYISGQENDRSLSAISANLPVRSTYATVEVFNDGGSVTINRSPALTGEKDSPSVYSRTTGPDTPPNSDGDDLPEMRGEPGTATIFASERTVYTSPKRGSASVSSKPRVQPSADWQQWMNTQIERIEKISPTREHIRETAQFQDDDDGIFKNMTQRRLVAANSSLIAPVQGEGGDYMAPEHNSLTQSNFSRPFSRSSSLRTVRSSQKIEPGFSVTSPSQVLKMDSAAGLVDQTSPPAPEDQSPSPMRLNARNLLSSPESPTPKRNKADCRKRMRTEEQYRRYSVRRLPIVGDGKSAVPFRSLGTRFDNRDLTNENVRQQDGPNEMMDSYHKLQDGHSTISSKRMVEMFLSSRRQLTGPEVPGENKASGAFL
ncbi:hypothetical protein N7474_001874 [Penicillium riverlandense]|uniref:uncharacterized protein n=1 Tax=Penicillium riverlandense TaxID=1903569 RepID=UPI0025465D19|nr:uncharacterized protein N7474_001874 [Penicillium riverlandense]KAJ5833563.1 hypothetical protein N7474_001874 [Penicillium riverlandense]